MLKISKRLCLKLILLLDKCKACDSMRKFGRQIDFQIIIIFILLHGKLILKTSIIINL